MIQPTNDFIQRGIDKKLIKFDKDYNKVTYITQSKTRNYNNPEEKVQVETYLKLILSYDYSAKQIELYSSVTIGSSQREADIIVFKDTSCTQPYIVIECKKEEVSELEFIQAIEQGMSYAQALPGTVKYLWITSGIKNSYFKIDKESTVKQTIPDIPHADSDEIQEYKYAKGGREKNEEAGSDKIKQKYFELETIDESELTNRFKQAHNALWAGGELNPSEAFDELDKLIFCKIWDERKPRKKGKPYDFQIFHRGLPNNANEDQKRELEYNLSKELFERIQKLYDEGKKKDPEVFKDNIRLSHQKVKTVVSYLESINLSETDLDSKGKAFETFMGNYFRGDFGQYFTPRSIVKFIVNTLPIKHDSKVLDTSCGSGGFLLYALDKVRREADEYFEKGSKDHWRHWHTFAEEYLYGIEINEQIARTAKMNMIIHDDGHTNVIASDGLISAEEMRNKTNNLGFKENNFDFIITNPPFGSSIKKVEKNYLPNYVLGHKEHDWLDIKPKPKDDTKLEKDNQSTEILFLEQCYNFLAYGGLMAMVIPDGILTNSSLQYVRNTLEDWYRIVAVVSMPQTAFAHTGAGVKSSVLFLRKWSKKETEKRKGLKDKLQNKVKTKHNFEEQLKTWDKEKKAIIKNHEGFNNDTTFENIKTIQATEIFKDWKKSINEEYKQKVDDFKEDLRDKYLELKREDFTDYDIFMAIAEDIGYDATGKLTGNNELEIIQKELAKFIEVVADMESF